MDDSSFFILGGGIFGLEHELKSVLSGFFPLEFAQSLNPKTKQYIWSYGIIKLVF